MACKKLCAVSAKDLLDTANTFIFGCDGVLWNSKGAIPGSLDTVIKLRHAGKRVFFITNHCCKTRLDYLLKFTHLGFPEAAQLEEIMCAAYLSALYLKDLGYQDKVFLVGNPAMGAELNLLGIPHIGLGPYPFEDSVEECLKIDFDPQVKCVLVGLDDELSYMKVLHAATYLQRPDCLFLATSLETHLPVTGKKVRLPGAGTMVEAVRLPSEREPTVLGMPEPHMFRLLQKHHNLDPKECVLVGDSLQTDMGLARACGLRSLLVLTGVTHEADLPISDCQACKHKRPDPQNTPDLYTSCLANLRKYI